MATHDWMKGERDGSVSQRPARAKAVSAGEERRSTLEIVLAVAGFATWLWCAYEVLLALVR